MIKCFGDCWSLSHPCSMSGHPARRRINIGPPIDSIDEFNAEMQALFGQRPPAAPLGGQVIVKIAILVKRNNLTTSYSQSSFGTNHRKQTSSPSLNEDTIANSTSSVDVPPAAKAHEWSQSQVENEIVAAASALLLVDAAEQVSSRSAESGDANSHACFALARAFAPAPAEIRARRRAAGGAAGARRGASAAGAVPAGGPGDAGAVAGLLRGGARRPLWCARAAARAAHVIRPLARCHHATQHSEHSA